jgi:uncharacterized protein (DUF608 family)
MTYYWIGNKPSIIEDSDFGDKVYGLITTAMQSRLEGTLKEDSIPESNFIDWNDPCIRFNRCKAMLDDCRRLSSDYGLDDGTINMTYSMLSTVNIDDRMSIDAIEQTIVKLHHDLESLGKDSKVINDSVQMLTDYDSKINDLQSSVAQITV